MRVALPAAGANWGAVLVPRIGTEVAVEFIEGDVDRPLIVGQLYNGADLPPFSAGVDSGVNHPGVISGLHTQSLDASGFNQWVMDDATGQLRMRMLASYTQAELGLGHLIAQSAGSANRGAWRGSGVEATTQGWASVRAAKGLLISSTARQGSYGSAHSTQMDAAEAVAQLKAAKDLGSRLGDAAKASTAHALNSFDTGQSVDKLIDVIDPKKLGKHEAESGRDLVLQDRARRHRARRLYLREGPRPKTHALYQALQPTRQTHQVAILRSFTPDRWFRFNRYKAVSIPRQSRGL